MESLLRDAAGEAAHQRNAFTMRLDMAHVRTCSARGRTTMTCHGRGRLALGRIR